MWSRNALTERLNLKWPILQAPMGSITTPALAAAREQRRWTGRARHVGFLGRGCGASHRGIPPAKRGQLECQLPDLGGTEDHPEGERGNAQAPAALLRCTWPSTSY
jgi:hypothetical protein